MDHTGKFTYYHTFCAMEISSGDMLGPVKTFNKIEYVIVCHKKGSNWEFSLKVLNDPPLSLRRRFVYKIKTKNGFEIIDIRDGRFQDDSRITFPNDPKYVVNGNMTIECHVELYEIDGNVIKKPRQAIENKIGIGLQNKKSQLATEEKELQTAISLSKKEFEEAMAKELQKAKQQQNPKQQQKKKKTLSCTICLQEYGEERDRTPRVLDCGHTLCLGCCKRIARPNQIQCPFCRVVTQLIGRTISNLPKNYLALSM